MAEKWVWKVTVRGKMFKRPTEVFVVDTTLPGAAVNSAVAAKMRGEAEPEKVDDYIEEIRLEKVPGPIVETTYAAPDGREFKGRGSS